LESQIFDGEAVRQLIVGLHDCRSPKLLIPIRMFSTARILSRRTVLPPVIAAVGLTSKALSSDTFPHKMTSFKVNTLITNADSRPSMP
jgi:hypothetical protein